MKQKNKKGVFLIMLLGTLGATLLGNLLTEKGLLRAGSSRPLTFALKNNKGKRIVRSGSGKEWDI